jgi:hypothetical protein
MIIVFNFPRSDHTDIFFTGKMRNSSKVCTMPIYWCLAILSLALPRCTLQAADFSAHWSTPRQVCWSFSWICTMLILFLQATAEVRNALKNVTCTYGFSEASSFDCGPPFIFVQMMTVGSFAFLVDADSDARLLSFIRLYTLVVI